MEKVNKIFTYFKALNEYLNNNCISNIPTYNCLIDNSYVLISENLIQ